MIKSIPIEKRFPKAYKYLGYLIKKHKINVDEMTHRAYNVERMSEVLKKIPLREYGEIEIPMTEKGIKEMAKLIKVV